MFASVWGNTWRSAAITLLLTSGGAPAANSDSKYSTSIASKHPGLKKRSFTRTHRTNCKIASMYCFAVTGAIAWHCRSDNRLLSQGVCEITADMDFSLLCMISVEASFIKFEAELARRAVRGVHLRRNPSDHDAGAGR